MTNSGENGMWSSWGVENLDQRVISKNPDVVFIEFGMNDGFLPYETSVATARDNLNEMIDRIQAANADCEIILMVMNPPTGEHLEQRPTIVECYRNYREVAAERDLLLVDHMPAWQELLTNDKALFDEYMPDGIHPEPIGTENIAMPNILKAIGF